MSNEGSTATPRPDGAADRVADAVADHPWLEQLTQAGWLAKGVVYTLMGLTALQIARQDPTSKDASPEGSIGRVAEAPLGSALLIVLTLGLLLYVVWRVLSVAVIRGNDLADWADRAGYAFSAAFYVVLAWTAAKAASSGVDPEGSNSVERVSSTLLANSVGRWLLAIGGLIAMGIGAYFAIHKGLQRSFVDDLKGVRSSPSENEPKRAAVLVAGMIGWTGRGLVTGLVGFFVTRAAVRFDASEARGFDRSLRQVAGTSTGSVLVLLCAAGLVSYGVFCLSSYRLRSLAEST